MGLVQHCAFPFQGVRVPSCDIVPNGPASSYSGSSNICQCLKCKHVASIPTKPMTKYRPISCATVVRFYVIDCCVLLVFVLYILLLKRNRNQPTQHMFRSKYAKFSGGSERPPAKFLSLRSAKPFSGLKLCVWWHVWVQLFIIITTKIIDK